MSNLKVHIKKRIVETQEAITRYALAIAQDDRLIFEFCESDPNVAQRYREWEKFDLEKLSYFQKAKSDLEEEINLVV